MNDLIQLRKFPRGFYRVARPLKDSSVMRMFVGLPQRIRSVQLNISKGQRAGGDGCGRLLVSERCPDTKASKDQSLSQKMSVEVAYVLRVCIPHRET